MFRLDPNTVEFAIVSFEGPDEYSRAGGLGVRVRDLSAALAERGFDTHLFFVGDPSLPSTETQGCLTLHRWSQWISAHHPSGVYDGEWGKMQDMVASLPPFLVDEIAAQTAARGRVLVLMFEDWQTAATAVATAYRAAERRLQHGMVPIWTANNTFGFHTIDFSALERAATVMTVSRYMKHEMWKYGVNPLVVPNGLGTSSLVDVKPAHARALRDAFRADVALFKIGRFSPDKRWLMAVEAVALLQKQGVRARMLMRGDRSSYGREVLDHARSLGLSVSDLADRHTDHRDLARAIANEPDADILNLTAFLPDPLVPVIYAAVDGVLANSGHEPFGLVGLEVMGAGGLAYVGSTGEEYAEPDRNSIVLDTADPREIVAAVLRLQQNPGMIRDVKKRGKKTASRYLWSEVLDELLARLDYVTLARQVEVPA